jgi:hypothetical protein
MLQVQDLCTHVSISLHIVLLLQLYLQALDWCRTWRQEDYTGHPQTALGRVQQPAAQRDVVKDMRMSTASSALSSAASTPASSRPATPRERVQQQIMLNQQKRLQRLQVILHSAACLMPQMLPITEVMLASSALYVPVHR